jgi:hypothetical protein
MAATTVQLVDVAFTSESDERKLAYHFNLGAPSLPGSWRFNEADPSFVNVSNDAVNVRMIADAIFGTRNQAFRGLPDQAIGYDSFNDGQQPVFRSKLLEFAAFFPRVGVEHRQKRFNQTYYKIKTFVAQTANAPEVQFTLNDGSTLPNEGDVITIRGVKPYGTLNRSWRVKQVEAGVIMLAGSSWLQAKGKPDSGEMCVPEYENAPFVRYEIGRVTTRKSGVPFGVPRGRRSKTRRS